MRRIFTTILLSGLFLFSACEKEPTNDTNSNNNANIVLPPTDVEGPAAPFVGVWTVNTEANMNAPVVGNITRNETSTYVIAANGSEGAVNVSMTSEYGSSTATGMADSTGLHLSSYDQQSSFAGMQFTMTVAAATIPVPVNGTTSWTASISGRVGIYNATGTLNNTATKQQ